MDIDSAFEVYKEAKARNIQPSQSMFYNLLSLSAGFGDLGSGCNTIRDSEPPSDFEVAFAVFRDMQAVGIPMSESAFTAMIRCCCNHNRHKEALSFYQELKSNQSNITPKLRCFTPLLRVFSIAGDQVECETLYDDLTQIYKIIPTEKEYNYMLSVCVCNNCSDVFYTVLEHMQDDVYVPSVATWAIIKEWFGQPRQASSLSMYSVSGVDGTRRSLRSVRDSVSNRVSESGSGSSQPNDELIEYTVCMSSVSEEGVVEINSEQLLSLDLDEPTRQALLEQIEGLATADTTPVSERSSVLIEDGNTATPASIIDTNIITADEPKINKHSVGTSSKETSTGIDDVDEDTHTVSVHQVRKRARKVHKELSPGTRKELFTSFKSYISTLKQKHGDIDVIVDGANVGYYKQNYANAPAHVDYTQINYMIIRLQNLGYKPLIILHCRHINYKYLDLTDEHIDIIETWKKLGLLYSTPAGCNDDWYWLYCAVLLRCKVVTNDEMRDHHFLMLSPR